MISKTKLVFILFLWPLLVNAQSFTFSGQTFYSITTNTPSFNPFGIFKIEKTAGIKIGTDYNFYDDFSLRAQFYYLDGTLTTDQYGVSLTGDLKEYSIELGLVWEVNSTVITPMVCAGVKYNTYKRSIDQYVYYGFIFSQNGLPTLSESVKGVLTPYVSFGLKVNLFDNVFYLFEMEYSHDIFDISRSPASNNDNALYHLNYEEDFYRLKYGIGIGVSF